MPTARRVALLALLAVLAAVPAVALGAQTRAASNSQTYPDSVGEDPQAPDITSTTVSNDDTGLITFKLAISNRPTLTDDMLVVLFLNTDGNTSTGDPQTFGAEYAIQLSSGAVDLFKWGGSDYAGATAPSLVYAYDASGATIKVKATDLGNAKKLDFVAIALSGITFDAQGNPVLDAAHRDATPDPGHGTFSYDVRVTVTLRVTSFTTSPKPVKAGKTFSVGLSATRSDTGEAVQQGAVTCSATVAGKRLTPRTRRLVNGVAVCVWAVPKSAKGKRIQGSVTLGAAGAQVTRRFSQKVA